MAPNLNFISEGKLTRMLILEQNVTIDSMCIAAATYRLDCRQPVQAILPPTHLAIAPAELHHGSSEFLELDIFPAYSMQFDSTYPNLAWQKWL